MCDNVDDWEKIGGTKFGIMSRQGKDGPIVGWIPVFLVDFGVTQILQTKIQVWTARLHNRTCRRALDRVDAMTEDAANRAQVYSSQTVFSRFRQSDCNQIAAILNTKLTILVIQLRRFWIENRRKMVVSAQHKRLKWATWWHHTTKVEKDGLVRDLVRFAEQAEPGKMLFGVGLLLGSERYSSADEALTHCLAYRNSAAVCIR